MTCITQSYSFISNFQHNTQNQASIIHTKLRKQSNIALPRPAPRSGWRVSLRQDVLAQASPLRLGEGSKKWSRSTRGISLRRDPSHLGEILARSKKHSRSLGRPFVAKYLGEPLLTSPRRDMPAQVSLTDIFSCSGQLSKPNKDPIILYIHTVLKNAIKHKTNTNDHKHLRHLRGFQLPLPGKGIRGFRQPNVRTQQLKERTEELKGQGKQKHEMGYLETLTEKNEKEQWRQVWASKSTYMEQEIALNQLEDGRNLILAQLSVRGEKR